MSQFQKTMQCTAVTRMFAHGVASNIVRMTIKDDPNHILQFEDFGQECTFVVGAEYEITAKRPERAH